jgi:hypothetical protein
MVGEELTEQRKFVKSSSKRPILCIGVSLKMCTQVMKLLIYYDVMNSSLKVIMLRGLINANPFNVICDNVVNIFSY